MSAQKPAQSDDPIELLADSMNVWVGKLSDIVHKVIDTEPIRNVINWARMYSLWPVNITTACCSAEFGAASGARHDLERFGVLPYGSLRQSDLIVIEGTITKKMAKRLRMIYDQMAIPRYVIAMGDCAISGGLFHDSYSIVNGAHEWEDSLIKTLKENFPTDIKDATTVRRSRINVTVAPEKIVDVALFLRDKLGYDHPTGVSAVDYNRESRFEIVYHLTSITNPAQRDILIKLKESVPRNTPKATYLVKIWPGDENFERESNKIIGIQFA